MRAILFFAPLCVTIQLGAAPHPGTKPLKLEGKLSAQMVAGIDRFLMNETVRAAKRRPAFWKRDYSTDDSYQLSVLKNRERFRYCIGAVDTIIPIKGLEYISTTAQS